MALRLEKLEKRKAALISSMDELLAKADAEDRDFTDEERAEFIGHEEEIAALDVSLERERKLQAHEAALAKAARLRDGNADEVDPERSGTRIAVVRERVEDDPKLGFKSLGDIARSVFALRTGGAPSGYDKRLDVVAATGMSQGTGSDGGFLVPPEFSTEIWDGLNAQAESLMMMTDGYTITGESITFNANAETSRATGSRFGGVRGYWISEAQQMTASFPKMRQMKLEPQELAVLIYATDKLIRNGGPALTQYLTRAAIEEIDFLVGASIIEGDGVGKPLGIVGHSATISVTKETTQAAATIVKANIDKMWSRCHARARGSAVWLINQDCEPQLEALAADVGTGGVPVYLPPGGITDSPNARLKGRPVIISEYCSTLGTVGDIILANLGFYATGIRGTGVDSATSMHLRFDYAETAFRFMFAADGQPWLASALTPFKGTNTLSPIVTLATRS